MSTPRIYASTSSASSQFASLGDQLDAYVAAGVEGIELGWSAPRANMALPAGLAGYPVRWLVHNYFPAPAEPFILNLASQDADTLARSRALAREAIRLSAELGAPFYSVHCGFLAEFDPGSLGQELRFKEICSYERGYNTFVESLQFLLGDAAAWGVRLLVEPNVVAPMNLVDGRNQVLMMAEPDEFMRLLSELGDNRLGVLLDLGHLNVTAATLGFERITFVDVVAARIGAFHLHDNDGTSDQHRPASPDGWAWRLLAEPRFRGLPVVVEAKFRSVSALVEHCIRLGRHLND